jgi:hypothetical protein
MAELMLGQPLFPGESGIDQLVEIIKVLGTPTKEQIRTMNPNYMEHKFPQIKPHPFNKVSLGKRIFLFFFFFKKKEKKKRNRMYFLTCNRYSVRPLQTQLTWLLHYWNILQLSAYRLSKQWSILSLTSYETHPVACLILVIRMDPFEIFLSSSTLLDMVSNLCKVFFYSYNWPYQNCQFVQISMIDSFHSISEKSC